MPLSSLEIRALVISRNRLVGKIGTAGLKNRKATIPSQPLMLLLGWAEKPLNYSTLTESVGVQFVLYVSIPKLQSKATILGHSIVFTSPGPPLQPCKNISTLFSGRGSCDVISRTKETHLD